MKLPGWKIAAVGGVAGVAMLGIIERRRPNESTSPLADPVAPVVMMVEEADAWSATKELDDETAGLDPDAVLPAKLQAVDRAAELEFAAVVVPQIKEASEEAELKNPSREELLLHIARNARKRKDYEESAKFFHRFVELQPDRVDVHYEYAEMLAEAGEVLELKKVVEAIERRSPPNGDVATKRLIALKEQASRKLPPPLPTPPIPPSSVKNLAGDDEGSTPKSLGAATVGNSPKSFDSLDPPINPSLPGPIAEPSKKPVAPLDLPVAPRPGFDGTSKPTSRSRDGDRKNAGAAPKPEQRPIESWKAAESGPKAKAPPTIQRDDDDSWIVEDFADRAPSAGQPPAASYAFADAPSFDWDGRPALRNPQRSRQRDRTSPPEHSDGVEFAVSDGNEQRPRATLDFDYFRQRGRNGLTDVDRYRVQGWLALNFGDREQFLAVGEGWLHDTLNGAPDVDGNVVSVRGQYRPLDALLVHAQLNGETYDAGFRDRLTYDVGAAWRPSERLRVYGGFFGDNVAENAESIRQDIHRNGVITGAEFSPNCWNDFGGFYRFADYSDDNQLNEFDLYASRRLSLWPDELKLIGDVHYWSYDSGTAYAAGLPFGAPSLVGAVHPYFAPGGYSLFSGHLEWKKALSTSVFQEADAAWFSLRGGGGVDSDGVAFAFGRAIFHRDLCYWLSFHSEVGVTESRVYRDLSAFAYLTARLRGGVR